MESENEAPPASSRFSAIGFFLGFGSGIFLGVALALLAVFLVREEPETTFVLSPGSGGINSDESPHIEGQLTPVPTPDIRPRTTTQLDVRLGPGNSFGVVGLLNRGEAVVPVGRDVSAEWLAIQFPAGSSARGWVPVASLDRVDGLEAMAVAIATPLPRAQPTVTTFGNSGSASGQGSGSGQGPGVFATPLPAQTAAAVTSRTPVATAAPAAGPVDLVVTAVTLQADGRILVTIGNRGPGDLRDQSVFVHVRDLGTRSEQIVTPVSLLRVGQTLTVASSSFRITEPEDVVAIVDPFATANEVDRSNNTLHVTLAPARAPTPPSQLGGG